MSYDDVKLHQGRAYSGVAVGGRHEWIYPNGRWREEKLSPDQWGLSFRSLKQRRHPAPANSGAPPGTMFHWLVVGHQRVRKVDANTYETFLDGAKWKIGHRRPHWKRWSTEYPGHASARERTIETLRATLERLESDQAARAQRLESALDPDVYGLAEAPLEAWADADGSALVDEG